MTVADRLISIASAQAEVYGAGRAKGKKEEYDTVWDTIQNSGKRTNYQGAFAGIGWNKTTFKPKYPISPTGSIERMFWGSGDVDLTACSLDTSRATTFAYMFQNSAVTYIPAIDLSGATSTSYAFASAQQLSAIDKMKVSENTAFTTTTFTSCRSLSKLIVEGTIAKSGVNLSACVMLNKSSITSIVNALSTKTSGLSISLSLTAVNAAYETSQGANDGSSSDAWLSLIKNKNWNINLV